MAVVAAFVFPHRSDDPVERHQHPTRQAGLHRHLDLHAGFEAVDVAVIDRGGTAPTLPS